jgi:hypothetical protein
MTCHVNVYIIDLINVTIGGSRISEKGEYMEIMQAFQSIWMPNLEIYYITFNIFVLTLYPLEPSILYPLMTSFDE